MNEREKNENIVSKACPLTLFHVMILKKIQNEIKQNKRLRKMRKRSKNTQKYIKVGVSKGTRERENVKS